VQILPVTTIGLQDISFRDLLLLRRPRLTIVSGRPFHGRDVTGDTRDERKRAVCARVDEQWHAMEGSVEDSGIRWRESMVAHITRESPRAPERHAAITTGTKGTKFTKKRRHCTAPFPLLTIQKS